MINNRKSDGEYVKPSCSILSIVEESMIATSPDPPTPPTPSEPEAPKTPKEEPQMLQTQITPSSTITTMFGNNGKGQLIA